MLSVITEKLFKILQMFHVVVFTFAHMDIECLWLVLQEQCLIQNVFAVIIWQWYHVLQLLHRLWKVRFSTDVLSNDLFVCIFLGACEENFGVYANPVDPTCTTFIQCSWSEPYVRDCNPGLLFNSNSKLCDFSNNVDCTVKRPKENKTSKVIINQGAMAISKNLK